MAYEASALASQVRGSVTMSRGNGLLPVSGVQSRFPERAVVAIPQPSLAMAAWQSWACSCPHPLPQLWVGAGTAIYSSGQRIALSLEVDG